MVEISRWCPYITILVYWLILLDDFISIQDHLLMELLGWILPAILCRSSDFISYNKCKIIISYNIVYAWGILVIAAP